MASASSSPAGVDSLVAEEVLSTRRAQRRQLHREVVARSRIRQRERVALLVKQETALRQRLTQLLLAQGTHEGAPSIDHAYATLVASQQQLLRENDALESLVHRHYLFSRLVQFERSYVLDDEAETEDSTPSRAKASTHERVRGVWLAFLAGEAPFFYEHESAEQCAYLVSVCFHLTSHLEGVFGRDTHLQLDVAHVLGWYAQRAIHWNADLAKRMLYFKFSRSVTKTQATLREIQQRSWGLLSSPTSQARIYSVPVTTQIAQQIDENAQIVLQHKSYHVPIWFFCLNAQACEPGIVRQSMMVLDRLAPEYDAAKHNVVWLREGIICLTFREDATTGAVEIEFSGCMRCVDDRHAQFMLLDVACVLVRWESLVVPSRLLTCAP